MIHAIETVVIDWVRQLRDLLKKDPSQALLDGLNPTPSVEIKFWENKCENLECIYEQVRTNSFTVKNCRLYGHI
jgi:dynein heavy chain